eukprot:COSAG01_NODE_12641_length_1705_cov_2.080324_1_plen_348_part_00
MQIHSNLLAAESLRTSSFGPSPRSRDGQPTGCGCLPMPMWSAGCAVVLLPLLLLLLRSRPGTADEAVGAPARPTRRLTVYHVHPACAGPSVADRDTGDARGDLYFLLRAYAAPMECVPGPPHRAVCGNHSCGNAELMGSPVVSQVELEVDLAALTAAQADLGTYAHCDLMQPGCKYDCSADGGKGKKLPSLGSWNISLLGGSGKGACSRLGEGSLETEYWAANLEATLVGEHSCFWYSTLQAGENVTWRQLALTRQVEKACADRVFLDAVESGPCFARAGVRTGAAHRDLHAPAWIRCFYATILGPRSNSSYDRSGGWSIERMEAVWAQMFSRCPDVRPHPPLAPRA